MRRYKRKRIFLVILLGIGGLFAFSALVMWLWNAILPDLINVGTLTLWKAMGLLVLSKILFSGFGGGKGKWGRRYQQEHWANMSAEEKEKFRNEWRSRCSWKENPPPVQQAQQQQQPQPPQQTQPPYADGTQTA